MSQPPSQPPPDPPAGQSWAPPPGGGGAEPPGASPGYGSSDQPAAGVGQPPPAGGAHGKPGAPPPPGTPGYGYPPAGYGYPHAGYGYPPGGYGYPAPPPGADTPGQMVHGAPTAGMPTGGSGSGKKRGGSSEGGSPLLVMLVGVVVAALVAGGFGGWHVVAQNNEPAPVEDDETGGDDDEVIALPDAPVEGDLLYSELQEESAAEYRDTESSWVVGDSLVLPRPDRVVSTDVTTGEEDWVYETANRDTTCLSSAEQSEGRIALLEGRDCEQLTILDLETGDAVWTLPVPQDSNVTPGRGDRPAILGDYVALGWGRGGHGWSISHQELLWEGGTNDACPVDEYGVLDGAFIESATCGMLTTEPVPGHVRATTAEGEELWRWEHEGEYEGENMWVHNVLHTDPLVVNVTVGESLHEGADVFLLINQESGAVETTLDIDPDRQAHGCGPNSRVFGACDFVAIHGDRLFMGNERASDGVTAFDLGSGAAVQHVEPPAEHGGNVVPFGVVDGEVLLYQHASTREPGTVLAADPETDEVREVLYMQYDTVDVENDIFRSDPLLVWDANRLFVVAGSFSESSVGEPQIAVFG